jgi:hypothetical protein
MPVGRLDSVYAYEVSPRQESAFAGGKVPVTGQLQTALDSTFDRSEVLHAPVVTFLIDTSSSSRSHPIRDAALSIAFANTGRTPIVERLAARLAGAMDQRSKPSLFMVSVHASESSTRRRVLLWTFPQQEVFTLSFRGNRVNLEMLEAFTRESTLRKLAYLDGNNSRTGMLTARVVDFQAAAADRAAADLWIVKFLAARLQMSDEEGTRLLARALRMAHGKTRGDLAAQEEISDAIFRLRASKSLRWSIDTVASTYLSGTAADAFINAARPEERGAVFGIDTETFDALVQYKRYILDNGVIVSAPFVEIGVDGGVEVSEFDGGRRLSVEGQIQEEQVRTRA